LAEIRVIQWQWLVAVAFGTVAVWQWLLAVAVAGWQCGSGSGSVAVAVALEARIAGVVCVAVAVVAGWHGSGLWQWRSGRSGAVRNISLTNHT
jgi:hypothetical protein